MEKIYVVGHKNPDTDALVSAAAMAAYMNMREKTNRYCAARCGEANTETLFICTRFSFKLPELIEDFTGKKVLLVDHNEATQIAPGVQKEQIVGVVDHHLFNFSSTHPLEMISRPWGSTTSVIYDLFEKEDFSVPEELLGPMLCAILSDTVILKSPTTTPFDMNIAQKLADKLDLDFQELGMELFKAKSHILTKSADEIIHSDYKEYTYNGKNVALAQIEVVDLNELETKVPDLTSVMKDIKHRKNLHTVLLMLTDILQEGSKLIIVSDEEQKVAELMKVSLVNHVSEFVQGMLSRKKQVAPILSEKL